MLRKRCPLLRPASLQPHVPPGPPPRAGVCCCGIPHAPFQNILCASLLPLLGSENYPKFSSQTLHSLQMHSSHRLLLRAPQPFQMELLPPLSCAPQHVVCISMTAFIAFCVQSSVFGCHPYKPGHSLRMWGCAFIHSSSPRMASMGVCTREMLTFHYLNLEFLSC